MLGYSEFSKGYRVYNIKNRIVEESINVRFNDKLGSQKAKQGKIFANIEVQFIGTEDTTL